MKPYGWVRDEPWAFNIARLAEIGRVRGGPRHIDRLSQLALDVLIPAADGDADVLAVTVEGVRRNLAHPLGAIWVVAPSDSTASQVGEELDCRVVDERSILPIRRADIDYTWNSLDRSGWLFQQLLKLSADEITGADYVLVLDADTVLVRPQTFTSRGRTLLFHSSEYHRPYFAAYRAITGRAPASRLSWTTHHTLMRRDSLVGLKRLIETTRGVPWWRAVLDVCDYDSISGFAETELYGNYEFSCGRPRPARRWWSNLALPRRELASIDNLERRYGPTVRTVSFHHYL